MALDASLVGHEVGAVSARCDARWLMAYAAGVPDPRPALYDTTGALPVHPLFPVAPEWMLLTSHRATPSGMPADEVARGVHSHHDVIHHRSLVAGETVDVRATVIGVDRRPAGATLSLLFEATDSERATIWRTRFTSTFLGVELVGEPQAMTADWPEQPSLVDTATVSADPVATTNSHVAVTDAHVYSECARIWNPIHTDVTAARRAGLDAPILHGTATLARAVSLVTALAEVPIDRVARVAGGFAAMVPLDSTIQVRLLAAGDRGLHFDVLNEQGQSAIRRGYIGFA